MTKEQISDYIKSLNVADLDIIKSMVLEREDELYEERWYTHDRIDDYLYIVHYKDGHTHLTCKGKDSYEEYINSDDAVWIERKTKDLFPTFEFLERKYDA